MNGGSAADCFVCRKHRDRGVLVPGGPVAEDELVLVSHVVTPDVLEREGTTAYMGHLFVEPRRHAPGLADLTDAEARSVGCWCTRASRALRDVPGAEHVYAAVFGDGVPHLHVHLLPRFPGTPREYWGVHVSEWPQARRGTAAEIEILVGELRGYLAGHDTNRRARVRLFCSGAVPLEDLLVMPGDVHDVHRRLTRTLDQQRLACERIHGPARFALATYRLDTRICRPR